MVVLGFRARSWSCNTSRRYPQPPEFLLAFPAWPKSLPHKPWCSHPGPSCRIAKPIGMPLKEVARWQHVHKSELGCCGMHR